MRWHGDHYQVRNCLCELYAVRGCFSSCCPVFASDPNCRRSYIATTLPVAERRRQLMAQYLFKCTCQRCSAEEQEGAVAAAAACAADDDQGRAF